MYNINPAVTKSILARMPKDEFLIEFNKIRQKYLNTKPHSNEHFKYASLYNWCLWHYQNHLKFQRHSSKRVA